MGTVVEPLELFICNSRICIYVSNAELAFDVYSCAYKKQNILYLV
jgi:hypothetical protein